MNKYVTRPLAALLMMLAAGSAQAAGVKVNISNDLKIQRDELVGLKVADVYQRLGVAQGTPIVVLNKLGQQLDYQITHDSLLVFEATVRPCSNVTYTIETGTPQTMHVWTEGKMYPMRKDDIAWENDRGAYRVYGPALQRTGEKSYGIDIWTKNTPDLVVSDRYYKDYEGNVRGSEYDRDGNKAASRQTDLTTSFHLDHGNGLDCYSVGPTLGCGTPALMSKGKLVLPYCWAQYRILDNGPLRFSVYLKYRPTVIDGDTVVENRIISLDMGSNFNKMTVWYDGLKHPHDLAAGVVVHTADTESVATGKEYVQYADPTDQPEAYNYQLYVGCLFPNGAQTKYLKMEKPQGGNAGHAIGIVKNLKDGEHYTYYFGSAWSKYDVRTQNEWQLRINETLEALHSPLQITMQ